MSDPHDPPFELLCEIIRIHSGFRPDKRIAPDMQFETDLGITGGDGDELLEAVENNYGIQFTRESFGLDPNEYLFNSEGMDIFGVLIRLVRRKPEPEIRSFTVGKLHHAILTELSKSDRAGSEAEECRRSGPQ
jgi:hypothetical protein